jgi:hypothetical protein
VARHVACGRHGHAMACYASPPRVPMLVLVREGTRGPFRIGWGRLELGRSLFQIVSNSSIFGICEFCPNLIEFKWLTNLNCVCLVELYLTRDDERWWWKSLIQRFAKIDKWEIVTYVKKLQLWLSIANDQERIWHGDLYKKCSP